MEMDRLVSAFGALGSPSDPVVSQTPSVPTRYVNSRFQSSRRCTDVDLVFLRPRSSPFTLDAPRDRY